MLTDRWRDRQTDRQVDRQRRDREVYPHVGLTERVDADGCFHTVSGSLGCASLTGLCYARTKHTQTHKKYTQRHIYICVQVYNVVAAPADPLSPLSAQFYFAAQKWQFISK